MLDRKLYRWVILVGGMIGILAGVGSAAGLVAHYKLDETSGAIAADSSGKGDNATIAGTPQWVAGHLNGAMQFSGSSPVTIPTAKLAMTSGAGSVAFWMNAGTGTAGAIRTMFWAGDNTTGTGFGPENEIHVHVEGTVAGVWQGGELSFFALGGIQIHSDPTKGAAGSAPVSPKLVNDSQWHHVAAVWDGSAGTGKLYLDGALINQSSYTSSGYRLTNMYLGQMSSGNRTYDGMLDDVRIYDYPLTDIEVQTALKGTQLGIASSPAPADAATDVARDVALQWKSGEYAAGHDVYLGTNFADVNTADRSNPMGVLVKQGHDANSFSPSNLQFGQTYYWRVDEVNAPPSTKIFKGDVWSFTAEPYAYAIPTVTATASGSAANSGPQNTVNGAGLSGDLHGTQNTTMWLAPKSTNQWIQFSFDRAYTLHQLWVWNHNTDYETVLGFGIKNVTIEYSGNGTDWTTLGDYELARATGAAGYAHNTTIDLSGIVAKQVKMTVKSGWGTTGQYGLSEVRFFYVPVWARNPQPASGATNIPVTTSLSWRAGRLAAAHKLYLSTDKDAVTNGTGAASTVATNSYVPSALGLATTYYWKVNEVNEARTPGVWEGDVWSFATPDFLLVDDMDSYNDTEGTRIFDAWVDGWGTSNNGAQVGYTTSPFAEQAVVHGGKQSLPFAYNNTGSYTLSEATRTFQDAQDWTTSGVKTLVLFFRGNTGNAAGQLYVKINSTKVTYPGDAAILTGLVWKQWNVDLAAIGGIKAVKTMTIGMTGSGTGTLYFDDIRLYKSAPAVATPANPGTANLMAYFTMEGNVTDASGHGYTGTETAVTYVDSLSGLGKAAQFNGTTAWVDLGASFGTNLIKPMSSCTAMAWVNYTGTGNAWQRIFDFGSSSTVYMFLSTRNNVNNAPRFAIMGSSKAEVNATGSRVLSTSWHHLAGVVDASTMTIALYVDGNLAQGGVATTVLPKDLGATTQNWLGRSQFTADPYLNGAVDDLRIYNRALSAGEVGYMAGDR